MVTKFIEGQRPDLEQGPFVCGVSLMAQQVKNPLAIQDAPVRSQGWEDPLVEEMAAYSSILALKNLMDTHFVCNPRYFPPCPTTSLIPSEPPSSCASKDETGGRYPEHHFPSGSSLEPSRKPETLKSAPSLQPLEKPTNLHLAGLSRPWYREPPPWAQWARVSELHAAAGGRGARGWRAARGARAS